MSIYFSRFALNTYCNTPYCQSQLPQGYPISLVLQKCRAFRRLPPNLKTLSRLAKRWAKRHADPMVVETQGWYDDQGYELDPDTGRRLTDAEIDRQWQPNPSLDSFTVRDVPIPPGGFADPDTWEEPPPVHTQADDDDRPTREGMLEDIVERGRATATAEYGLTNEQLPLYIDPQDRVAFTQRGPKVLASGYFFDKDQARYNLAAALRSARCYADLGDADRDAFDRAEAYQAAYDDN